jgi:hypothetical protein
MPQLIISNHLVKPLCNLYGMYSDMVKDQIGFRPEDWGFWFKQVDARDKLWAYMNSRFGEEKVRAYALGYDL